MNHLFCAVSPASTSIPAIDGSTSHVGAGGGIRKSGTLRVLFSRLTLLALILLAPVLPARTALAIEASQLPPDATRADEERNRPTRSDEKPRRRFALAAADLTAALVLPWAMNNYVAEEEWSRISLHTLGENVHSRFCFDEDDMPMNQMAHPLHGNVYFNAGRTNGFTFWESTLVATLGSLAWEYGFENTAPSRNDMFNTVLGGAVIGETSFRLSRVILDNTASGAGRLFRELAGALVNPVSGVNRLVTGEAWRKGPNPDDRLPDRLDTALEIGWARNQGTRHSDTGVSALALRYGDPFESPVKKPFDSFDLTLRVAGPSEIAVTGAAIRGVLGAWRVGSAGDGPAHLLGVGMRYDYLTPNSESFASESFEFGLFSRFPLRKGVEIRTEAQAVIFPIAAVEIDCPELAKRAVGRTYDFSFGGGARLDARLTRDGIDLVRLSWAMAWFETANGVASSSRLQWARAEGRLPVTGTFAVGAAWSYSGRSSTYSGASPATKTHTQGSAFVSWHSR